MTEVDQDDVSIVNEFSVNHVRTRSLSYNSRANI